MALSKFEVKKLDVAAQLSDTMAELLAKANGAAQENSVSKSLRDKAFTHLKEAVDEVRAAGKYAFKADPDRFKGYVSRYKRQ
ncbi:hypothetical protein M0D21_06860 [Aquimarina sp. D1M17]|uniref:hypothetical protein n=1 Tax=Aquimarina acroporae TaxID=2937283 RepID=UPI0020C12FB5|nr:hypothetical protein [Aquimarina acroporae]MCK8521278.1 hypothetical protein [Aquimarina acroporae]